MINDSPTPPTPPAEDKPSLSKRAASTKKSSSTPQRGSKRTSISSSHDHGSTVIDGRHKRVWKACERCRMKKTKCDGESPCKRCKDDGLVCTAGSRKKTEFKQLPRGYAEVLENTQYALIATVQKLYTMVRNNESWVLGEPELNDRGLPVIHNIAEMLGCIRPSPDMPCAFPEDEAEFVELQRNLFASKVGDGAVHDVSEDESDHKHSRAERASSTESDHSALSHDYTQHLWQQQQQQDLLQQQQSNLSFPPQDLFFKLNTSNRPSIAAAFDNNQSVSSMESPVYSDFAGAGATDSPIFKAESPYEYLGAEYSETWNAGVTDKDFLTQSHLLDLTALYMRQQQQQQQQRPLSGVPTMATGRAASGYLAGTSFVPNGDGTIRPAMLEMEGTWGMDYDAMTMG